MKIAHLTTQLPGYVNKDTEAVIIHLGTNDISGQANKATQNINELTQKLKTLHYTHFYLSESPPPQKQGNSHIRDTCSKLKTVDYMPTPVTKQHLSRDGILLNDKGQQKLTAATANRSVFSYTNHHNKDKANVNNDVMTDQVGEIRVLSWNINGLGNKMADPNFLEFIREYDLIFLT